ncbi:MAG: hypothetical protein ACSLFK_08210 [Gemmatimonadaceae bacterium]
MKVTYRIAAGVVFAGAGLLSACQSNANSGSGSSADSTTSGVTAGSLEGATLADSSKSRGGMQGMQGMQGGMMGGMMDSMQTQMRMMEGVSEDDLKAMLPAHRTMAANMLSQLEGEMRKMNMQPDMKWKALTDSIRQDLVRMPEVSASETRSFMAQHGARIMRLTQMHRSMMGGTYMKM